MIGCKVGIEDLKLAHRKVGKFNSYEYASIIYGKCGYTEEAAKYAKKYIIFNPLTQIRGQLLALLLDNMKITKKKKCIYL